MLTCRKYFYPWRRYYAVYLQEREGQPLEGIASTIQKERGVLGNAINNLSLDAGGRKILQASLTRATEAALSALRQIRGVDFSNPTQQKEILNCYNRLIQDQMMMLAKLGAEVSDPQTIQGMIQGEIDAFRAVGLITNEELLAAYSFGDQFRSKMRVDVGEAQKWLMDMKDVFPEYMRMGKKKTVFESKYGMLVVIDAVPPFSQGLTGTPALNLKSASTLTVLRRNIDLTSRMLDILHREFSLYPPELFHDRAKRIIYLLESYNTVDEKGVPVSPIPASESGGVLKIDIQLATERNSKEDIRGDLHHELFHALDGSVQEPTMLPAGQDPEAVPLERVQASYNREWYKHFPPGQGSYTLNYNKVIPPAIPKDIYSGAPRGFLTGYSVVDADEDRAVIAGTLMSAPQQVFAKVRGDAILREKVQLLIGCTLNEKGDITGALQYSNYGYTGVQYFQKWSNGKMDIAYWKLVQKTGKHPILYPDSPPTN